MNRTGRFLFGKPKHPIALADTAAKPNCANCRATLSGPYCSQCGQKKESRHDFGVLPFLGHTFHAFTHFDSTFFRTFRMLVRKPGFLTREYILGHRKSYMNPLQLFLVVNIIYFLLLSLVQVANTFNTPLEVQLEGIMGRHFDRMVLEKLKSEKISFKDYAREFNIKTNEQAKTLIILMVPFFAGLSFFLYWRRNRYFLEHLVFSFHFYSFVLIFATLGALFLSLVWNLIAVIFYYLGMVSFLQAKKISLFLQNDENSSIIITVVFITYLFIAGKRAFGESNAGAFIKAFVLAICFWLIVFIYRWLLFYTTFFGLHLSLH